MPLNLFQKSIAMLMRRQTNILSAAFIIMATVIFSQILGLVRQRLLVSIFGASDTLGVYLASTKLPDFFFQLLIAGALSSAFIPVFSDYLAKEKKEEAYAFSSSLLFFGLIAFSFCALFLFLFPEFFSRIIAPGFDSEHIALMGSLMRIVIFGELLFIVGSFLSTVLQSYNHFFVPGIAAAMYNLGIIIGIVILSPFVGIYAAAYGVILGALIFCLAQIPMIKKVDYRFYSTLSWRNEGVQEVFRLMWPRTLSIGVFQLGTIAIVALISLLASPGRNYVIFDYAQTLAFAPVVLFGQTIAQAAFPVLSAERKRLLEFKATFLASFTQMLYLVLPVSALFLVLRIPFVRLVFGAAQFDWEATVLTGKTLAFFSVAIFAQALIYLVSRGFYALHDTKTPLVVGIFTTGLTIILGFLFVLGLNFGVESIALAHSISGVVSLVALLILLGKKTGGFERNALFYPTVKIFTASVFTGFALYIPIKLLDQLVIDTTRTIGLLLITGISSFVGLSLYLFLTWLFNVKEAATYILIFKRIGNWREILEQREETIEGTHQINP
ncbi:MAG: murein biosynthesis integral membrane protein MurJ [Candidatus Levybacteria bacterium]|nr:murein biosynthesis integral membrane protein MurJ [Candidatus Levybacteria bacterium]